MLGSRPCQTSTITPHVSGTTADRASQEKKHKTHMPKTWTVGMGGEQDLVHSDLLAMDIPACSLSVCFFSMKRNLPPWDTL